VFCCSNLCKCSSEVICASVLVNTSFECSSEVICASVLLK
jgi:hypothetical protein